MFSWIRKVFQFLEEYRKIIAYSPPPTPKPPPMQVKSYKLKDIDTRPGSVTDCLDQFRKDEKAAHEKRINDLPPLGRVFPDVEKCISCHFYRDFNQCRKRAPVFVSFKYEEKAVYPYVEMHEWCGDYKRKEE